VNHLRRRRAVRRERFGLPRIDRRLIAPHAQIQIRHRQEPRRDLRARSIIDGSQMCPSHAAMLDLVREQLTESGLRERAGRVLERDLEERARGRLVEDALTDHVQGIAQLRRRAFVRGRCENEARGCG